MSVEITVNWVFFGAGEKAQLSYRAGNTPEESVDDQAEESALAVLPTGSSVIAPGLAVAIPV
jgi:hypothetical protein